MTGGVPAGFFVPEKLQFGVGSSNTLTRFFPMARID